jgi:hypothetical protein
MKNIRLEKQVFYLQNIVGLPVFIGFSPAKMSRLGIGIIILCFGETAEFRRHTFRAVLQKLVF